MHEAKISYHFECCKKIKELPQINQFDLVRVMGIAFDNAIEESKTLPSGQAQVNVMIYQDEPGEFEFEIDNKFRSDKLAVSQLSKAGFTTKRDHRGLGLANVRDVERKYENVFVAYEKNNDWFKFNLVAE